MGILETLERGFQESEQASPVDPISAFIDPKKPLEDLEAGFQATLRNEPTVETLPEVAPVETTTIATVPPETLEANFQQTVQDEAPFEENPFIAGQRKGAESFRRRRGILGDILGRSAKRFATKTAGDVGSLIQYLGQKALPDPEKGPSLIGIASLLAPGGAERAKAGQRFATEGDKIASFWERQAEKHVEPEFVGKNVIDNPDLLTNKKWWISTAGEFALSSAVTMLPAVGAAKWILALKNVNNVQKLARIGGAVVGGVTGGSIEALPTYRQVIAGGGSPQEAADAAEGAFVLIAGLNAVSAGKFLGKAKGVTGQVKKAVGAGAVEGVTEAAEEPADVVARLRATLLSGKDMPDDIVEQFIASFKAAATVALPAALTGGGVSTATGVIESQAERRFQESPEGRFQKLSETSPNFAELDRAVEAGEISPDSADLAKIFIAQDEKIDSSTAISVVDKVREATPEILEAEGIDPNAEGFKVVGSARNQTLEESPVSKTAIEIYQGSNPTTAIEELYHSEYRLMDETARLKVQDAYNASGEAQAENPRSVDEWNAQTKTEEFFAEPEKPKNPIARAIDKVKDFVEGVARGTGVRAPTVTAPTDVDESSQIKAPDTPEFKSFFKDSKVLDEQGEPLVVYHGTQSSFDAFEKRKAHDKEGKSLGLGFGRNVFYFSSSPGAANQFAFRGERGPGYVPGSPSIVPAFLSVENPFDAEKNYERYRRARDGWRDTETDIYWGDFPSSRNQRIEAFVKQLKKEGHDGIVFGDEYAVFEPTQIKSATGNVGTFDPTDPRISFQTKPPKGPIAEGIADRKAIPPTGKLPTGKVKKVVRRVTGQTPDEEQAKLKVKLSAEARGARVGEAKGKREATAKERERQGVIKTGIRERQVAKEERAKEKRIEVTEKGRKRKATANETRDIVKRLKKVQKRLVKAEVSKEQLKPLNALLAGLDLVRIGKRVTYKLKRTREYFEREDVQAELEIPEELQRKIARLDKVNLNDISPEDLRDIQTAVLHHVHLEATKKTIKVGRQRREAEDVLKQSISEMKPAKVIRSDIIPAPAPRGLWKTGNLIKNLGGLQQDHYDLITESLGGRDSVMHKVLFTDVKAGIIGQIKYKQDTYDKFKEDLVDGGVLKKDGDAVELVEWMNEEVKVGKYTLTRGERMSLYRHSLIPDNRRAILRGGIGFRSSATPDTAFPLSEEELDKAVKAMTKREVAFANKPIDNLFDNQYEELNKVFEAKNGYELPKVDRYFPKAVMPFERGSDDEAARALDRFKDGQWTRVGIEKGMLTKRLGSKKAIYLDNIAKTVNRSIVGSASYIGLELPLTNASKLLYNKEFKSEIRDRYGFEVWKEIEKGLRDIAGERANLDAVDQIALRWKNNLAVAALGLNPFVMAKQVASLPLYMAYVKPDYVLQGTLAALIEPKKTKTRHLMYSPEFRERVEGGFSRDVADVMRAGTVDRLTGASKGIFRATRDLDLQSLREKTMAGIKFFDEAAVVPGMEGAVLQALDELRDGRLTKHVRDALEISDQEAADLSPGDQIKAAYKFADYVTERTQPMFSAEHRSPLSRGGTVAKMGTMFGGFTNQALNLIRRSMREAGRTGDKQSYVDAAKVMFLLGIVNPFTVMGIDKLRDLFYGRESKSLISQYIKNTTGYVFLLRDIVQAIQSRLGGGFGGEIEVPALQLINSSIQATADWGAVVAGDLKGKKKEKKVGRAIDHTLEAITMNAGLPYRTPKKIITTVVKRLAGETLGKKKKRPRRIF